MRERLIALLAQLVVDGKLSEEQVAGILINWREIAGLETILPLAGPEGVRLEERDEAEFWALFAAVAGYLLLIGTRDPADAYRRLRRLGAAQRIMSANQMQNLHAAQARKLAADLDDGRLTVAEWQRQMRRLNAMTLDVLIALGASGPALALAERQQRVELEQAAYLQRFADHLAGNWLTAALPPALAASLGLVAQRWTRDYVAQRAAMYSGVGRAMFFEAWETAGGGPGQGWVVRYAAMDDNNTCYPCSRAVGYYLPGTGPYPGDVCLGGGACRCSRWPVYDPAMYAQLAGLAARGVTP